MTPTEARGEFQACLSSTYLDVAARAPMPDRVARELASYLAVCRSEGALKGLWLDRVEAIRGRVARLVGATPSEIAFVKNTSDGINTLLHAIGLEPGDNVIICPETEHPNNIYPWLNIALRGIELRYVAAVGNTISTDAVAARLDSRTRAISVSSVSFSTGARANLAELSQLCSPVDAFLLVDAAQELGILPFNVKELGIHGAAAGTQKGLLGLYGLGVMYCSADWLARMRPVYLSRTGVALDTHESEMGDLDDFELAPTAARFEVGNPNFAGLFALDAAVSLLEDVGPEAIGAHVLGLAQTLIGELTDRKVPISTPTVADRHAGIVAFHYPEPEILVRQLDDRRIKTSLRRGKVRVSFHLYNDENDIAGLLRELDRLRPKGGSS